MKITKKHVAAAVSATATAALAVFGLVSPAQAATTNHIKIGTFCMKTGGFVGDNAYLQKCTVTGTTVHLTDRAKYDGHRVVSVQFTSNKLCLDEYAYTSMVNSPLRVNACNSGSYQQFEVFNGSVKGTVVLKSLGIWKNKQLHRCIQVNDDGDTVTPHPYAGEGMFWNSCGTSSKFQQFTFTS